ncbi:MAG TPA: ABC transporter ATP-binding protein [Pseudonocardiaceae bacterium]|jgi:oligopeptide/dipeptide ABC transporter ATP-binding protein|nr:ABC transporter ATP-binding protein [Pseudonocardiaceae bacterium]
MTNSTNQVGNQAPPTEEPLRPEESTGRVLDVTGLTTHIQLSTSNVQAVDGISLHLEPGETLGLVGESGCGKSMTGLSIMGLLPPGGAIVGGSVKLDGRELVGLPAREMRAIRGNEIAMVFQDPMTSLDPTKTIGYQVAEGVSLHRGLSRRAALDRAAEVLGMVGLPRPKERLGDYPHQLSGGLRQRVMIAIALACEPKVLIADEPTTALDVTIQAQILELLSGLKDRLGMAMLLVTHDMGVVAGHADRVNVMYAGEIVETTDTGTLFEHMHHPYTRALLGSIPRLEQDNTERLYSIAGQPPDLTAPPAGCRFAARCALATDECREKEPELGGEVGKHLFACWHPVDGPLDLHQLSEAEALGADIAEIIQTDEAEPATATATVTEPEPGATADTNGALLVVDNLVKEFPVTSGILQKRVGSVKAVSGVSFQVGQGRTFGLVGESGCGKTTIGRMIVALEKPDEGQVTLEGSKVSALRGKELRRGRRDLQMMFQDPFASLDPRMRVSAILREPLQVQGVGSRAEQMSRINDMLDEVGLPRRALERFPHEFSGGQRQRIGLARALILNPRVIVADEPVSALDVSIRAQVLNLMKRLQAEHGLSYVVISHDLAVVKYLADEIGVMYLGRMVEFGSGDDIYHHAAHPYTAGLINTIPIPDPRVEKAKEGVAITGEIPSPINPPSGCRFRTRCPLAQEKCAVEEPQMRLFGQGHQAACHFPLQRPMESPAA